MHYKKYRRPTVREALRAVREDLGPSALVLSTRMVRSGGLQGWFGARVVEISAAAEPDGVSEARPAPSVARPLDPSTNSESPTHDPLEPHARSVAARLTATGLGTDLAARIARHPGLKGRSVGPEAVRTAVAETLAPLTAIDRDLAPVEVFIGPPGVGKTTTIAKIAAQARATTSSRVWLVAADGFRVGAVEQLRLYAGIMGAPFLVARSGEELSSTLDGIRRPLLVDTAGRSPRDAGNAEILDALAGRRDVRRHLVLPADTTPAQARRIIDRFSRTSPDRLVLTRLDETTTVAPLINVLEDYKLPISYFTHGQSVPDDLQRATPTALADWVLGETISGACA
jgi:flagellar biosynthesis protein FlhF